MTAPADSGSFLCRRCGRCCSWPGAVRLTDADADALAARLGLSVPEFLARHAVLLPDRTGLALRDEGPGAPCPFLDAGRPARCRVYEARPEQCRGFPFRWSFPGHERECPGAGAAWPGAAPCAPPEGALC